MAIRDIRCDPRGLYSIESGAPRFLLGELYISGGGEEDGIAGASRGSTNMGTITHPDQIYTHGVKAPSSRDHCRPIVQ